MFKILKKITLIALLFFFTDLFTLRTLTEDFKENGSKNKYNIPLEYLEFKAVDEYILGKGDTIFIGYNNNLIRNEALTINSDGTIYTKRLKRIFVEGLTLNELTDLLNQKYKDFIINPNIIVEILNYRPIRVFVSGEVISPGSYILGGEEIESSPYNNNEFNQFIDDQRGEFFLDEEQSFNNELRRLDFKDISPPTLFDAIKIARGITLYSDLTDVQVIRKNPLSKGGGKIKASLNFFEFIETGSGNQNIRLMDGDTIIINKSAIPLNEQFTIATKTNLQSRFNRVFISGRVQNPGMKVISKSATLNDLILLSGESKPLKGNIYLVRFNYDGTLTRKKIRYSRNAKDNSKNNPILRSGDIVSVDSNLLLKTSETISDVTNPLVGIFSSYQFFKMLAGK